MSPPRTRVLIVDDSPICRTVLSRAISQAPDLEVVGEAEDGEDAVAQTLALKPSVITLDLQMPKVGGLEAIDRIMGSLPTPILVVTEVRPTPELDVVFEALSRGALDVLIRPRGGDLQDIEALHRRIRMVANLPLFVPHRSVRAAQPGPPAVRPSGQPRLVAIGASTGGPRALAQVLETLPRSFEPPILIAQHLDARFHAGLVQYLASRSTVPVKAALSAARLEPRTVYIAPPGAHLELESDRVLRWRSPEASDLWVPSIDRLFHSVAQACPGLSAGVLLTGIGDDGAAGLLAMRRTGSYTLAQDQRTSTVFGMPRAAQERGAAHALVPIEQVSSLLADWAGTRQVER